MPNTGQAMQCMRPACGWPHRPACLALTWHAHGAHARKAHVAKVRVRAPQQQPRVRPAKATKAQAQALQSSRRARMGAQRGMQRPRPVPLH